MATETVSPIKVQKKKTTSLLVIGLIVVIILFCCCGFLLMFPSSNNTGVDTSADNQAQEVEKPNTVIGNTTTPIISPTSIPTKTPTVIPTKAPTVTPTPILKTTLLSLKDKLVSILEADYAIDSVDKATVENDVIIVEASHSNWVKSIMETDMYGDLKEFAENEVKSLEMVNGNPKITLKFYSALDGASLQTTTDWSTLFKIKNKELSLDDWKQVNQEKVQGGLY